MKRSEINGIIRQFEDMLARHCFALPPFTGFTPEQWAEAGHEWDEVRQAGLGWDAVSYTHLDVYKRQVWTGTNPALIFTCRWAQSPCPTGPCTGSPAKR